MNLLVSSVLLTVAASNGGDAVTACRAVHESDPPAHIACLEKALRGEQTPASPPSRGPSLGEEQVDHARNLRRPEPVNVEIESVSRDREGHLVFNMADGQVWRETETGLDGRLLEPGKSYPARIERGKVRGYRMYIDGIRRMIKVERIK
jgi:hypothetical protein